MFPVKSTVPGLRGVNYPNVCPEQPSGMAIFCQQHLALAEELGYPTDIRAFLKFCGAAGQELLQPLYHFHY